MTNHVHLLLFAPSAGALSGLRLNAGHGPALRAVRQSHLPPKRWTLGGSIQIKLRPVRALSSGMYALRRTQSGSR
jgi:hypothetical protein